MAWNWCTAKPWMAALCDSSVSFWRVRPVCILLSLRLLWLCLVVEQCHALAADALSISFVDAFDVVLLLKSRTAHFALPPSSWHRPTKR